MTANPEYYRFVLAPQSGKCNRVRNHQSYVYCAQGSNSYFYLAQDRIVAFAICSTPWPTSDTGAAGVGGGDGDASGGVGPLGAAGLQALERTLGTGCANFSLESTGFFPHQLQSDI